MGRRLSRRKVTISEDLSCPIGDPRSGKEHREKLRTLDCRGKHCPGHSTLSPSRTCGRAVHNEKGKSIKCRISKRKEIRSANKERDGKELEEKWRT